VAVADLAHQRPVLGRRDDDAARTLDRLGDEGGDGVGALMLAIGYLAPFPGSAASEGMGTDEKNAAAE